MLSSRVHPSNMHDLRPMVENAIRTIRARARTRYQSSTYTYVEESIKQESGSRKQESEIRKQKQVQEKKAGNRKQETGTRSAPTLSRRHARREIEERILWRDPIPWRHLCELAKRERCETRFDWLEAIKIALLAAGFTYPDDPEAMHRAIAAVERKR
jgi:hypothetical protein